MTAKEFFDQLKTELGVPTRIEDSELQARFVDCVVGISVPFSDGSAFIRIVAEERGQNKKMREVDLYQDIKINQVTRYTADEIADVIKHYAATRKAKFFNFEDAMAFTDAQKLFGLK